MKIAVVGATGLVGSTIIKVLEERGFSQHELIPTASAKSVGKMITFGNKQIAVVSIADAIEQKPDFAIFSAGSGVSLQYAPLFAEQGTVVIDNSSAWRKYENIPLVVPEINASAITTADKIIANPNCSTIQMVLALAPLHKEYKIKRVVVSTYQSVSGTGIEAIRQLESEENGENGEKVYPYPIHRNLFPHGGDFLADGYTTEEQKLVDETRKILNAPDIALTGTVVRVPVIGGHSEAVNIEFHNEFEVEDVIKLLSEMSGITIMDNPQSNEYPMPLYAKDKDDVFVGRIRRDFSQPKTLNLWIVADNLRKGAATNAVQIMEYLSTK